MHIVALNYNLKSTNSYCSNTGNDPRDEEKVAKMKENPNVRVEKDLKDESGNRNEKELTEMLSRPSPSYAKRHLSGPFLNPRPSVDHQDHLELAPK